MERKFYKLTKPTAVRGLETCQQAFDNLKDLLTSSPILAYPEHEVDGPFILDTDEGNPGIWDVLLGLS